VRIAGPGEMLAGLGKDNGIDLILPNKINTKEWEQNRRFSSSQIISRFIF
jgi:hypothetical protein